MSSGAVEGREELSSEHQLCEKPRFHSNMGGHILGAQIARRNTHGPGRGHAFVWAMRSAPQWAVPQRRSCRSRRRLLLLPQLTAAAAKNSVR